MSFFNDEFDLVDDDALDLFTLSTPVARRRDRAAHSTERRISPSAEASVPDRVVPVRRTGRAKGGS